MTTNPAAAGSTYTSSAGAIRGHESSPQAGPHIALSAEQIEGYISRIDRIKTAELHRFERRQAALPSSRASSGQLTTPEITRRIVQEPATPPSAAEAHSPIAVRPGVSSYRIIAFLAPELREAALAADQESQLLSTGGATRV